MLVCSERSFDGNGNPWTVFHPIASGFARSGVCSDRSAVCKRSWCCPGALTPNQCLAVGNQTHKIQNRLIHLHIVGRVRQAAQCKKKLAKHTITLRSETISSSEILIFDATRSCNLPKNDVLVRSAALVVTHAHCEGGDRCIQCVTMCCDASRWNT